MINHLLCGDAEYLHGKLKVVLSDNAHAITYELWNIAEDIVWIDHFDDDTLVAYFMTEDGYDVHMKVSLKPATLLPATARRLKALSIVKRSADSDEVPSDQLRKQFRKSQCKFSGVRAR